eukprot:691912-Prorocentrum_lima.AAC.1
MYSAVRRACKLAVSGGPTLRLVRRYPSVRRSGLQPWFRNQASRCRIGTIGCCPRAHLASSTSS